MTLYAESSAVLAWLLDEPAAADVRRLLAKAEVVIGSDLTLIECDRVLHRAAAREELTEADAPNRRALLVAASAHWHVLRLSPEVVERARQPFPGDPIRTLDAIHLASALGPVPGSPGSRCCRSTTASEGPRCPGPRGSARWPHSPLVLI